MPSASSFAAETAAPRRWLSIVGIGEDGADGLSPVARGLIADANIVFGGKRHLELAASLIRGAVRPWPSPFDGAVSEVMAQRGRQVCVLASGDPFFYGIGALLTRHIDPNETIVLPVASAFSLAAARLGWPLPETALVSLHGLPLDLIRPHLQPGARLLVLTSDGAGPGDLAVLLSKGGFGASRFTILESLGGSRERVRTTRAAEFSWMDVADLNVVAIEVEATSRARTISRAPGLPDAWFEHDGQITKREMRALTLSALAPRRGELLWDIGAGAGSVAIEWLLSDVSMRAVAIEARPDRAARIRRNAAAFGVPGIQIVEGQAPRILAALPAPQAIFIGGGATEPGLVDTAVAALSSGGRLVVNAVTLETETLLIPLHAARGGELIRIALARAEPVGEKTGWRSALLMTQWAWTKP